MCNIINPYDTHSHPATLSILVLKHFKKHQDFKNSNLGLHDIIHLTTVTMSQEKISNRMW